MSGGRQPIEEILDLGNSRRLLVLTYHLQHEALLRMISRDDPRSTSAINKLQRLKPVIVYDAKVTGETRLMPQFVELRPRNVRGGIHHSKAWCTIESNKIQLVLGSFNLTESGLFRNREIFKSFSWSKTDSSGAAVIREFIEFLRGAHIEAAGEANYYSQFIKEADELSANWKAGKNTGAHLITSGYGNESGLAQVVAKANFGSKGPAKRLLVVSPFFDTEPDQTLLAELQEQGLISEQTHLTLMTSLNRHLVVPMLKSYLSKWREFRGGCDLYLAAHKIDADNSEHEEIDQHTRGRLGNGLRKDSAVARELHGKLLAFFDGSEWTVYCGSANFTRNAWLGLNQELGWIETLKASPEAFTQSLANGFNATLTPWDQVVGADDISKLDREEENAEVLNFPNCLASAALVKLNSDQIQFKFVVDVSVTPAIDQYKISWGSKEIRLSVDPADPSKFHSQTMELRDALMLLAKRNLELVPINYREPIFFYPFVFDEALSEDRHVAVYKNSDEWLSRFLSPESNEPDFLAIDRRDEQEEAAAELQAELRDLKREKNKTIAMQRFLTQYLVLEKTFLQRVSEYENSYDKKPDQQSDLFNANDPMNLIHYFKLLEHELTSGSGEVAAALFKIGEALALLRKAQEQLSKRAIQAECQMVVERLKAAVTRFSEVNPDIARKPMFQIYLDMISDRSTREAA